MVDPTRFDQFTRQLATGVSRRQVLQGIVGFVVGSVFSQVWSRPHVYAETGQGQATYLPLAMRMICSEPSRGTNKKYCGDYPDCICIESAEGEIQCGKIPPCSAPPCTTSADCAHLGPGYFCDTPFSGDCLDAAQTRCIPPCTGDCPREQRCGDIGCCAEGDRCVNGQCVRPDDCALQSITLESMRAGLAELAAGATTANVSPQGCIQVHQGFTNGEVVARSFTINGKKVSDWLRTHKQWAGYRDSDLDGFYEWRSVTVEGDTPDERVTTVLEYSPTTMLVTRRTTLTTTAAGVHVKREAREDSGAITLLDEYDAPLLEEVALGADELPPSDAAGVDPTATCEGNPCNPEQIKARMEEGVNFALQCFGDLGERGVAMYEAAFNTLARQMTVRCASIPGDTQANIGGWDDPQGILRVTVDPAKFCELDEGQRAWLMFHEILHPALQFSHNPAVKNLPLAQRNQIDRLYGCVALCYTHKGVATKCMCAQCLDTVTCDPLCAAFNSDCGATCPCPAMNNKYYSTCNECLAGCPNGLTCKGYLTCTPVGQSSSCPPVTCP